MTRPPLQITDELLGDTYAEYRTFTGGLEPGERISGVEFDNCTFTGAAFEGAVMTGCTFEQCTFERCNISRLDVTDSRFVECFFTEGKALAVNFARAHAGELAPPFTFERYRLDFSSFQGLDVSGSTWRDCSLREADFAEATARRAVFTGSDLTAARFVGTDLRDADFVGALNYGFDLRDNQVKGARFDAIEAARLLLPFGVTLV